MPKMFHSSLPQHRLRKIRVVKSRYHLQKVFFPLFTILIVLLCTLVLLNYPIIKEHIEFLIPKNQYLVYGFAGFVNLFVIIYCSLIIKEYFTLSITLKENTLKVKHYMPIKLDIHNIDDITIKHSMLGKMLGYSTITILNKNRSVLKYSDIINGPQLRRAIKKILNQQQDKINTNKSGFNKSPTDRGSNSLRMPIRRKNKREEHEERGRRGR